MIFKPEVSIQCPTIMLLWSLLTVLNLNPNFIGDCYIIVKERNNIFDIPRGLTA